MNPVLLGSLAALCWGVMDFLAGKTSRSIGPLVVAAAVTGLGFLLITLWLLAFGTFPNLVRGDVWWPALAGIAVALATLFFFAGIASGPMSLAVPIALSYPATSVVLGVVLGNVPTPAQLAFVALILAGALLVAWGEAETPDDKEPGRWRRTVVLSLLAHAAFVIGVSAGQRSALFFDEIQSVWISRLAGSAIILPLLLARPGPLRPGLPHLPILLLMGFLDVVAVTLLFAAGKTAQPELATVCGTASGAITIVLSRIFLHEKIAYLRWIGIAATFTGVAALSAL